MVREATAAAPVHIGYDQARLYLPLQAGDNELVVVVADGFGGMGLMARFPDATGLEIDAR